MEKLSFSELKTGLGLFAGKYGISDQVSAMSFDTTASNTGHRAGACVLLEKKLTKVYSIWLVFSKCDSFQEISAKMGIY